MPTYGPNNGSTAANVAESGYPWSNPSNAFTANGTYATSIPLNGETTDWLKITGFNFNVSGTILGILVEVLISVTTDADFDSVNAQLVSQGVDLGSLNTPGNLPTVQTYISVGGATKLWNTVWTTAMINDAGFGVKIKTFKDSDATDPVKVDHVRITVFTAAGGKKHTTISMSSIRLGL